MSEIPDLERTSNDESFERILKSLISPDNAELKSDIKNPRNLALYIAKTRYINNVYKFSKLCGILDDFRENFVKLMYSFDRKSREEMVQAFIAIAKEKEKTSSDLQNIVK